MDRLIAGILGLACLAAGAGLAQWAYRPAELHNPTQYHQEP